MTNRKAVKRQLKMIRITALMDNMIAENKSLFAEHGLSLLIEKDTHKLLFDCGQGAHTLANAHRLGRDLSSLDAVILSHNHYDHAAGFRDYAEQIDGCRLLYTGPHVFEPKYAFDGLKYTDLSSGFDEAFLNAHNIRHVAVEGIQEIFDGICLVSSFPRRCDFETIPGRFVKLTAQGFLPDDFSDEVCLVLDLGDRLCVLVGCSHPGILNMIRSIHDRFQKPVSAVFGGTHLVEADPERIGKTVRELKEMGLQIAGFSHCSGSLAEGTAHEDKDLQSCHLGAGDCIYL